MNIYNNILGTIGNTPVVRLNNIAPKHVNLFVKLESFNPMGSVKDRLALGVIEAAEKSGATRFACSTNSRALAVLPSSINFFEVLISSNESGIKFLTPLSSCDW